MGKKIIYWIYDIFCRINPKLYFCLSPFVLDLHQNCDAGLELSYWVYGVFQG